MELAVKLQAFEKKTCVTGSYAIMVFLSKINTPKSLAMLQELNSPNDIDIMCLHTKGILPNYKTFLGYQRVQNDQHKSTTYELDGKFIDLIFVNSISKRYFVDGIPLIDPTKLLSNYQHFVRQEDKLKMVALSYIIENVDIFGFEEDVTEQSSEYGTIKRRLFED